MKLPEPYLERMKRLLGCEYDSYMKSLNEKRCCGLRVNTLKIGADAFLSKGISDFQPVPWCKDGFYYNEEAFRPSKHPYYNAGLYYIQEPSAMAPVSYMDIKEGDRVLDLCSAPGGKTVQIALKIGENGFLLSNDISASRTKAVVRNIELAGVKNALITSEAPDRLAGLFPEFFDKILVDAPCSGEGMFRKDPLFAKSWSLKMCDSLEVIQKEILSSAALMLKPGGSIMYSTCTFSPYENEHNISGFLKENESFDLVDINEKLFSGGFKADDENTALCARIWPHKLKGEGHFMALMRKKGESEKTDVNPGLNNKKSEALKEFEEKYLNCSFTNLKIIGDLVYYIPFPCDRVSGIRIQRSGLLLGNLAKERFEPSAALAMAIKKEDAASVIDLPLSDERVIKYLKGETIEIEEHLKGYALFCVDGFPLGWGKADSGRLKNKYNAAWKWE